MALSIDGSGLGSKFREILEDLTTLEINTVIKEEMTGRKMPRPRLALVEILEKYDAALTELVPGHALHEGHDKNLRAGFRHFRDDARRALKDLPAEEAESANGVLLRRIERNSDYLAQLLDNIASDGRRKARAALDDRTTAAKDLPPLPLEPNEIVAIRKIWDMGGEEVVLQTFAQLDGDVVTRVKRDFTAQPHPQVLQIHKDGVELSLRLWRDLVQTVVQFFGSIVESVLWRNR